MSKAQELRELITCFDASGPKLTVPEVLARLRVIESALAEQPAQHPDDQAVDRFAAAMKDKLTKAREKGRSGWETCPPEGLSRMLREHIEKGDPRDVANFAMMLWSLGAGITAPVQQEPAWYHVECNDPDFSRFTQDKADALAIVSDKGGTVEALYTSAQPAQRKPLPYNKEDMKDFDVNQRLAFKLGWKSAEEAHGIKEQP